LIHLARRICKASRNTIKYKFGVRIPHTSKEALELDAQNGNTLWKESMDIKIHQLLDFETCRILKRESSRRLHSGSFDCKCYGMHQVFGMSVEDFYNMLKAMERLFYHIP